MSAVQIFNLNKAYEEFDKKEQNKVKKRNKKIHRKAILEKVKDKLKTQEELEE